MLSAGLEVGKTVRIANDNGTVHERGYPDWIIEAVPGSDGIALKNQVTRNYLSIGCEGIAFRPHVRADEILKIDREGGDTMSVKTLAHRRVLSLGREGLTNRNHVRGDEMFKIY